MTPERRIGHGEPWVRVRSAVARLELVQCDADFAAAVAGALGE